MTNHIKKERKVWGDAEVDALLEEVYALKEGKTYPQLAALIGIAEPTIVRWLLGKSKPSALSISMVKSKLLLYKNKEGKQNDGTDCDTYNADAATTDSESVGKV